MPSAQPVHSTRSPRAAVILTIARRELLDTWRDGQVRVAAAILSALLLLALIVGIAHARDREATRRAAQAEDARVWVSQGALNPHSAAHFGRYLFKPVGPLAFVDEGINPYAGSSVYLEAHVQTPARARPAEDATFLSVFGELTAALTLQLLIPLLIILCAFAAFSGERENGTFRQLLSLGVPRTKLLAGKALGLTAAIAAILLPLLPIGAGALLLNTQDGGDRGADLLRLALLCSGYLAYFAAFIGLTLAVSALAGSSRAALVILLGCWLAIALLLPRLAADAAERLAPVPTITAFKKAVSEDIAKGVSGHDPSDARLNAIKQKLFKQYGVSRVEDLPINFDGIDLAEGERYGNQVLDVHYGRLWQQYDRQAAVQRLFAIASPLIALRPLSMSLSGTDLALHRAFTEQAEGFRRQFIAQINDYYTANGTFDDWSFTADQTLWKQIPPFVWTPPSMVATLAPQGPNLLLLLGWTLAIWLFAAWAIGRAKVDA